MRIEKARTEPTAPRWIRAGLSLTDQLSPALSGKWAQQLFFTPRGRRPKASEREFLESGTRFDLESKHGRIAAYSWGDGDEPVFLIHGWGGHAAQLAAFVPKLCEHGLRAVAIDMPAHGASSGELSSIVHFADSIEALAHVTGAPYAVIAHSLGAAGTTLALAREQVAADRLVYLAAPAELEPFWARFRRGVGLSADGWSAMQISSEEWLGIPFEDCVPLGHAPDMTLPLLLLHDAGDREIPPSEGRALAGAWPGAVYVETEGLGHNRILKDATVVARAIDFATSGR
jgi:pimeloyl-ACP methyl ester carboxylesterase